MVDMEKAIIIKELRSSDDTVDTMRKMAVAQKKFVVAFRHKDNRVWPTMDCTPQGDVGEAKAPTLKVSVLDRMANRYLGLAEQMFGEDAPQTVKKQLVRRFGEYNTLASDAKDMPSGDTVVASV